MARYRIVPERSSVWIDAKSSVHPINTKTDGIEGFIEIDVTDGGEINLEPTPEARLSLPVDRLQSGNALEDRELRRRIDARRFPTIDGVLRAMRSDADGRFTVEGDITFRGETRTYEEEMSITPLDDGTLQLEGRARFDVRDFGMEP